MITVTCMPDKMSNEKEKKRKREKEKIKGKEKVRKSEKKGGKRSITYDTATTMATKEERGRKKQANKRGKKKPGEK